MAQVNIAVDIGASSGRLILGWLEADKLQMKEIHRFKNSMVRKNDHFFWDVDGLFDEIVKGLIKASKEDVSFTSIGIDTWAVDYVLVDASGERVAPVYAYRDHRTDESISKVLKIMDRDRLYNKTGIQFLQFNTLFQLYEHVRNNGEDFNEVSSLMLVPDYLHFKLSGIRSIEYTNATSTQMLDVTTKGWDMDILDLIGMDPEVLSKPVEPGTVLGKMTDELENETGITGLKVIAPATHDTGSAVVSVPAVSEDFAYISSGTWSLMGIESDIAINGDKAKAYNFTNEGGVFGTYRVLKNIIGLWLIQEVARMYNGQYSFAELAKMAEEAKVCGSLIDPDDERFLNPENMIDAIQGYCDETNQKVPKTPGEISRCILESLGCLYRSTLDKIRDISDQPINKIHIIGGGCQNKLLNKICADYTDCEVHAGPIEATAIGNLMMQMIAMGKVKDLAEARSIINKSFDIEIYKPEMTKIIEQHYEKFRRLRKNG